MAVLAGAVSAMGGPPETWRLAVTDPDLRGRLLAALEVARAAGAQADLAPVAGRLLLAASEASESGVVEGLAHLAVAAAPSDPRPHAFLFGHYAWASFQPLAALAEGWRFAVLAAADPWVQATAAARLVASVVLAGWFATFALVLAGGAWSWRLAAHDYRDSFPRAFRGATPALLALLLATALWTAGAGPALLVLLAALTVSPYYPRRARWALAAALGLGSLLSWPLGVVAGFGGEPGARAWALYRVWRGDAGDPLAAELARTFPPQNPRGLFARARVARRGGQLEEAADLVRTALAQPGAPDALLRGELGTLHFQGGKTAEALAEFHRQAAADPRDPLPWFNLHVVHLARLELGLADEALERARALGGERVERLRGRFAETTRLTGPVPPVIPAGWVWREALIGPGQNEAWVSTLVRGLFLPIQSFDPALLGLLGLVAVLPTGSGRRSHRCPSCGVVVCPRCGRRVKEALQCAACWAAEREEAAGAAEKALQAERMVVWRERRERRRRALRVILPGWSEFIAEGGALPLFLGVAWSLALGWVALSLLYPLAALPWEEPGQPWVALGAAALAHALGPLAAPRRAPGRGRT